VGRGGGSAEDLDAFNTEKVVRAIAASEIPVVSAVGHEIDITLSDLAADRRAPTPTAAAEIVILESAQWSQRLSELGKRLRNNFQLILQRKRIALQELESRLTDPRHRLSLIRLRLDDASTRLAAMMSQSIQSQRYRLGEINHRLQALNPAKTISLTKTALSVSRDRLSKGIRQILLTQRTRLDNYASLLESYNPRQVLQRGYSITLKVPEEMVVKDAATVSKGDRLKVLLAKGALACEVKHHEA